MTTGDGEQAVSRRPSPLGQYVRDPLRPAGVGWCEAVIPPKPDGDGNRYCYTMARFEREGRRCCGLHLRAGKCRWGAQDNPSTPPVPEEENDG